MNQQTKIFKIENINKNKRLDIFLSENLTDLTRSYIKTLIEKENVLVNNTSVKSGYKLKENDEVVVNLPELQTAEIIPQDIPLDIVYEDEYLAVINKPQNMIVHPAGSIRTDTLVNALMFKMKNLSGINGVPRKTWINARHNTQYNALPTFIRNKIDHPDATDRNNQIYSYTEDELRLSIDWMLSQL